MSEAYDEGWNDGYFGKSHCLYKEGTEEHKDYWIGYYRGYALSPYLE